MSAQGPGGTGVQLLKAQTLTNVVKGESERGGLRGHGQDQDMGSLPTLTKPCCSRDERKGLHVVEGVGASVNRVDSECWNQASSICQEARKRRHSQGGPRTLIYCHQVLSLQHQDRCIQVSLLQLLQVGLLEEACD